MSATSSSACFEAICTAANPAASTTSTAVAGFASRAADIAFMAPPTTVDIDTAPVPTATKPVAIVAANVPTADTAPATNVDWIAAFNATNPPIITRVSVGISVNSPSTGFNASRSTANAPAVVDSSGMRACPRPNCTDCTDACRESIASSYATARRTSSESNTRYLETASIASARLTPDAARSWNAVAPAFPNRATSDSFRFPASPILLIASTARTIVAA